MIAFPHGEGGPLAVDEENDLQPLFRLRQQQPNSSLKSVKSTLISAYAGVVLSSFRSPHPSAIAATFPTGEG